MTTSATNPQISNLAECLLAAPSGRPCRYPADCCPFHSTAPEPSPVSDAPGAPEEPAHRSLLPPEEPDMRHVAREAIDRVLEDGASPLQVARLVRTLAQLHAMGPAPLAQYYALKQVELRGRIMHGQPPRNDEEWELARAVFDDEAIAEFERWDREITRLLAGGYHPDPDADFILDLPEDDDELTPIEF